jgi:hypothetical protein
MAGGDLCLKPLLLVSRQFDFHAGDYKAECPLSPAMTLDIRNSP